MYFKYCEELYSAWKNNSANHEAFLEKYFDFNALPEPYLTFNSLGSPLYFLTTNPGGVLDFQKKENFEYGQHSYSDLAGILGTRYLSNRDNIGTAAVGRINRMIQLAKATGKTGVVQVEAIPYHSKSFPNKDRFLKELKDPTLIAYLRLLREHLQDKPVLSVQAGAPDLDRIKQNKWITFLCNTMSLNMDSAKLFPIKEKDGKVTVGVLWDKENRKGIIFNQAANNFPDERGISTLINILSKKTESAVPLITV